VTYLRGPTLQLGGNSGLPERQFNGDPGRLTFNTDTDFINGAVLSSARTVGNVAEQNHTKRAGLFHARQLQVRPSLTLELGCVILNMTRRKPRTVRGLRPHDFVAGARRNASTMFMGKTTKLQPRWLCLGRVRARQDGSAGGYGTVDQPITGYVNGLPSNPPLRRQSALRRRRLSRHWHSIYINPIPSNLFASGITPTLKMQRTILNLNVQHEIARDTAIHDWVFRQQGHALESRTQSNQPTL